MWTWQSNQYMWRPGFWVNQQPGWMWVPASNSWTPNGYVANQGYWDYPFENRGIPFAPVYFSQPIYGQPNFQYTPAVSLVTSALLSSLFVRPSNSSYYFGDYYAPSNFQSGIYPWYAFHGSRYGYDPLYAYAAAQNFRTNPRWADELHEVYSYRREHPEARPPHTFAETRRLAARPAAGSNAVTAAANLVLARPLNQLAAPAAGAVANPNVPRLERIDAARRQEFARQATQLHKFREDRLRREAEARRATPPAERSIRGNPSCPVPRSWPSLGLRANGPPCRLHLRIPSSTAPSAQRAPALPRSAMNQNPTFDRRHPRPHQPLRLQSRRPVRGPPGRSGSDQPCRGGPQSGAAARFGNGIESRINLLVRECSDAIHPGRHLLDLPGGDRSLRPSEQGCHHGQFLDVEPLGTRRSLDRRRLLPRDAERLDGRGVCEGIFPPDHRTPAALTLIPPDCDVRTQRRRRMQEWQIVAQGYVHG